MKIITSSDFYFFDISSNVNDASLLQASLCYYWGFDDPNCSSKISIHEAPFSSLHDATDFGPNIVPPDEPWEIVVIATHKAGKSVFTCSALQANVSVVSMRSATGTLVYYKKCDEGQERVDIELITEQEFEQVKQTLINTSGVRDNCLGRKIVFNFLRKRPMVVSLKN